VAERGHGDADEKVIGAEVGRGGDGVECVGFVELVLLLNMVQG
jgi:hypothetical protein